MIFDELADIDDLLTSVGDIIKAFEPPIPVADQEPPPIKIDDLPIDISDDKPAQEPAKSSSSKEVTDPEPINILAEPKEVPREEPKEEHKEETDTADFLDTLDLGPTSTKTIEGSMPASSTKPVEEDIGDFLSTIDLGTPLKTDEAQKKSVKSSSLVKRGMLEAESAEGKEDDVLTFLEESTLHRPRSVPDNTKPWMKHHEFLLVRTLEEVNRIVDECIKAGFCSLDLETTGLDNRINWVEGKPETVDKIVGFCISYDGVAGYYIPVRHNPTDGGPSLNVEPTQEVEAAISRLCHVAIPEGTPEAIKKDPLSYKCERPKVIIGFWNAQFDQEFLYPITGIDWWHPESFEDGMLACFTVFAGDKRIGLKPKAKELLRDPDNNPYEMIELKELFVGKRKKIRFDTLAPDEPGVLHYVGADSICTYLLCQRPDLVHLCHEKHEFTYRIEKQITCVLRVVERNRVRINREIVREILTKQNTERDRLLERIQHFAKGQGLDNLDPNSPKQLSEFLFGSRPNGLDISPKPEKNEASGQYKTDGDTLGELAKLPNAASILKDIVKYREAEKFIGTYLEGLVNNPDENSELRFSFKQTGAASGRFSAPQGDPEHGYSGVPVHGIPNGSEVRRAFEARPGYITVKADYAGEELRIAANVSGEEVWIKEFLHGSGDLHSITARAFFGKQEVTKEERNMGKCVHPESLVFVDGVLQQIKFLNFSETEDAFEPSSGYKIYSGSKWEPITATYNGGNKPLVHVITSGGILTCAKEHSFKTRDGSFVQAINLEAGSLLEDSIILPEVRNKEEILHFLDPLFVSDKLELSDFLLAGQIITKLLCVGQSFDLSLDDSKGQPSVILNLSKSKDGHRKEVIKILDAGLGPCVDVSVGNDHVYVVNGFLTHNTANFALLYGGGPQAVIRATGCDKMEARRRKQAFDKAVPTFAKWIKNQHVIVKRDKGVKTAFGRWLAIPDANNPDEKIRAACERYSTNYPIQGCIIFDTLIITEQGYKQIGILVKESKPFLTWTGEKWALATAHCMGSWELATIRISDGTDIRCDTRHKLLVVTEEGYSWINYEDLKPGMKVATSLCEPLEFKAKPLPPIDNQKNVHNTILIQLPKNENDLWYWLGRYIGDGWISNNKDDLTFVFGKQERNEAEQCALFWASMGVNVSWKLTSHRPNRKEAFRIRLTITSKNLVLWLAKLGFVHATAHTKRIPEIVFQETLEHRKAFIRGIMESDGSTGKPERENHNIHLCQRPLLEDVKLLLRSVGVESQLRGPYSYTNKKGKEETSFRLDLQIRMYEREVRGKLRRWPKFPEMLTPRFLIEEFLGAVETQGKKWTQKTFSEVCSNGKSSYILLRRLMNGGNVSIYTLKYLCKIMGVELDSPIYGYKKIVSKKELKKKENTYTLRVKDPLHRFDAEGVITKNSGADIMKIVMIMLHKEFHKRAWLKNGDDSIRMLLTVHDEIVFEIRYERVAEAIPLIANIMESPWRYPKDPPWRVPLVVEPLVGFNWASGYKAERMPKDYKPKETEVVINNFVYDTTRKPRTNKEGEIIEALDRDEEKYGKVFRVKDPPWLMGENPVAGTGTPSGNPPVEKAKEAEPLEKEVKPVFTDSISVGTPISPATVQAEDAETKELELGQLEETPAPENKILKLGINQLNAHTARQVFGFVWTSMDIADPGSLLHLTDIVGNTIVPVSLNIWVDETYLIAKLREHNLLSKRDDQQN